MDTRTGNLISIKELEALKQQDPDEAKFFKEIEATREQAKNMRVGRNDRCPCSSGKKFKHCCLVRAG